MRKITEEHNWLGSVEFFESQSNKANVFLARPHGVINPSLLREDVKVARAFSRRCNQEWDYVTNTEDVKIVNPLNLFYLKEVKKIKRLKRIVIFAPNFINYLLIQSVSKIVKPDIVFRDRKKFIKFLTSIDST